MKLSSVNVYLLIGSKAYVFGVVDLDLHGPRTFAWIWFPNFVQDPDPAKNERADFIP